jgi:solute carrier family 25 protein 38
LTSSDISARRKRLGNMESTMNPVIKSFLAGSASGTFSTLFFQPLDLVKTRLQQNLSHQQPRVGGAFSIARAVVGSERGVLALWTGFVPSITRTVPGVGIYFGSLELLKTVRTNWDLPGGMAVDFTLGVMARILSASIMNPISVVKTRFESRTYHYNSMSQALSSIFRSEGARGLICGLLPTVIRDAPYSGCYFMFYTQLKDNVVVTKALTPDARLLLCKMVAGVLACAITHPADVVKTQMQLYPGRNTSFRGTVVSVAGQSGFGGFMTGFAPRMIRRTLVTALAWTIYEKVMATKTRL